MTFNEQIREQCRCVKDVTDDEIAELVNIVSMMTCWMRDPCETFLIGRRREVVDLPSCAECPVIFEPYYRPFDVDSFKFRLVRIQGIEEEETEITEFKYSGTEGVFRIDAGLPSCKCGCDPCNTCPVTYKMVAEYDAGYRELPDCLLPVFCNVLEVIRAKNDCKCCNDCGCDTQEEPKYASGDVVTVQLETEIGQILVEQYKNQLGMISLCRPRKYLWGVVV